MTRAAVKPLVMEVYHTGLSAARQGWPGVRSANLILRLDLGDNAGEMIEEHHRIAEALKKGDSASARAVMRESIKNARQAVLQVIMRCGEERPL